MEELSNGCVTLSVDCPVSGKTDNILVTDVDIIKELTDFFNLSISPLNHSFIWPVRGTLHLSNGHLAQNFIVSVARPISSHTFTKFDTTQSPPVSREIFAACIVSALTYLHAPAQSIVVGLISPASVRVCPEIDTVLLYDFSFAWDSSKQPPDRVKRHILSVRAAQAVRCIAPEVYDENSYLTPQMDVYSLAQTMSQIFKGTVYHDATHAAPEDRCPIYEFYNPLKNIAGKHVFPSNNPPAYSIPAHIIRKMRQIIQFELPEGIPQYDIVVSKNGLAVIKDLACTKVFAKPLIINGSTELSVLSKTMNRCDNIIPFIGIASISEFCPAPIALLERASVGDLYSFYDIVQNTMTQTMPKSIRMRAMSDIVAGMQFLSREINVMHWDIKLENILANRGRCQLCDFDHARRLTTLDVRWPASTPDMVAPEQLPPITTSYNAVRCEMFTLGLVFMAITISLPYIHLGRIGDDGVYEIPVKAIASHLAAYKSPVPPHVRAVVDPRLLQFIDKLCHFFPDQRFHSLDDVESHIVILKPVLEETRYIDFVFS